MTTPVTFDQALAIARQLSPDDQARLVSRLATELAIAQEPPAPDVADAWARLLALSAEMRQTYPDAPSVAAQLEADRRDRDMLLMGQRGAGDVHA